MHSPLFHSSVFQKQGFRRLSAIEIAEGALLANVGIIFHIAALYLPQIGGFFHLFIPVLFAVLALRRGLYVGIMGLCVTICLLGMLVGIHGTLLMVMECGSGLFLGFTMRHHWRHFPLILLGVTSSSLLIFGSWFVLFWLIGLPISETIRAFQQTYAQVVSTLGTLLSQLGLGVWWKTTGEPQAILGEQWLLRYWWGWLFVGLWIVLWPLVTLVYYITNSSVRMLGYNVRPFPGGWIERTLNRLVNRFIRQARKHGWIKRSREDE